MTCKRSLRIFLACPKLNPILNPVMTKLTLNSEAQLNDLISETIMKALYEDGICEPDMSDLDKDSTVYDEVYTDRQEMLVNQAIVYIKNNLH